MAENIISILKTNISFLTNVEKKIALCILSDPQKFVTYSMSDLSKEADVSQGSIINFSKKFANGGFPELKLMIAYSIANPETEEKGALKEGDDVKSSLMQKIKIYEKAFSLTFDANEEKVLKSAVDKILNANKVEIYGIFRSAAVATDFCYLLLELGIPASFVSDILTCSISATMLDERSVVIAVSSSGKTKDIIDAVNNAKENNVPVICITGDKNSPLAKLSDDVLIASASGNSPKVVETEIRMSQILIIDAICSYIRANLDESYKNKYTKLRKILSSHNVEEGKNE